MLKSWLLVLPLYLFTLLPLYAQPEVQAGRTADGVVYFLPKTVVRFHLTIEKTTSTPGEFARYAERYLHLKHVLQEQQVSHRVVSCDVSTFGVRDTSKCFSVRLKGKAESTDVRLADDGVLLAVNMEPAPNTSGRETGLSQAENVSEVRPSGSKYLSAEALAAGSVAKMAELTARQIFDLREQRQQLATGEADDMPQDEQQLRLMLQRIDQQHDALMTLFTGTTQHEIATHEVVVCPERPVGQEVLFRLSSRMGMVDADDLSGVPFYLSVQNLYPTDYPQPDDKKHVGFYVCQPGMARLTLSQDTQQLASYDIPLAQFGFLELREGDIFKRGLAQMQLHPATGAVVTLSSVDK